MTVHHNRHEQSLHFSSTVSLSSSWLTIFDKMQSSVYFCVLLSAFVFLLDRAQHYSTVGLFFLSAMQFLKKGTNRILFIINYCENSWTELHKSQAEASILSYVSKISRLKVSCKLGVRAVLIKQLFIQI